MTEDSGVKDHSVAKSTGPRDKRALVRAIAIALLVGAAVGGIWLAHRHGAIAALIVKLQALPQSPNWDWWVGGLFALLSLLGVLVLWKVPQWQVARVEGLDSKERFDKRNEARKTLATILGGVAFLTGGYFTWRNFNLAQENLRVTEQGQITDRFAKAIEQLGATESDGKNKDGKEIRIPMLEVRLGAIYSLEAVANESQSFHWPIMEVLSTYVRMNAPVGEEHFDPRNGSIFVKQKAHANVTETEEQHPREDIQAILTVFGRRKTEHEPPDRRLDLSHTDLRGAVLIDAQFANVSFSDSDLEKAILFRAHLKNAYLHGAHLEGAQLMGADLRDADLSDAYLGSKAMVFAAGFEPVTDLSGADLSGADLTDTDLRGIRIGGSSFEGDPGMKRVGIDFSTADLNDADVNYTDLSAAKNLTQGQVDSADGNAETSLPQGLCLPRSWNGVTSSTPNVCPAPK